MTLAARRAARLCGAALLGVALAGCGANVPSAVQQSYDRIYPGLAAKWERQPYGYEAVITVNEFEYEAEFAADGTWLETEYELAAPAFPPAVIEAIGREYDADDISKYEVEITPEGAFYEIEVERGGRQIERYYDAQGEPADNSNEDS
ncbi:MAG TPA: PepSY-like domain-containing protein [Herpetosiphonaceae bacterium]